MTRFAEAEKLGLERIARIAIIGVAERIAGAK
jgi:hypothetical protein